MLAFRRTVARRRVVVTLITGRSFEALVWAKRGPLLVLRDAFLMEAGQRIAVDGEVVIERPRIEFIQVLPTPHA